MFIIWTAGILTFIVVGIIVWFDEDEIVPAILAGTFLGAFVMAMVAIALNVSSTDYLKKHRSEYSIYTKEISTVYIKSLDDDLGRLNGSFFLGSGNIDSYNTYVFYAMKNDSISYLRQIKTDNAYIIETSSVVKYETHIDWSKVKEDKIPWWLLKNTMPENYYNIYVPKNTVIIRYNLDTK